MTREDGIKSPCNANGKAVRLIPNKQVRKNYDSKNGMKGTKNRSNPKVKQRRWSARNLEYTKGHP